MSGTRFLQRSALQTSILGKVRESYIMVEDKQDILGDKQYKRCLFAVIAFCSNIKCLPD